MRARKKKKKERKKKTPENYLENQVKTVW